MPDRVRNGAVQINQYMGLNSDSQIVDLTFSYLNIDRVSSLLKRWCFYPLSYEITRDRIIQ